MKKWMMAAGILILVGALIANGYFFVRQNRSLQDAHAEVTSLKAELSAIKDNISDLQNGSAENALNLEQHASAVCNTACLVEPTVVRISVGGTGFVASGSGFIVKSNGYVLTNQHVIENATSINVTLMSGDTYSADVVGSDRGRDLALLKMVSTRTDFSEALLGTATDIIVGDPVIAAGFPLGLELPGPASFTDGIVSAIRIIDGWKYIQTDTATNPGNSGGCLTDLNGKVIGIITAALVDAEGITLAIPIDEAKAFIEKVMPR